MGVVRKQWGEAALEKNGHDDLKWFLGVEIQEGILMWHIGTDVFLCATSGTRRTEDAGTARLVQAISNYMMFLLVERPYMLPGLAQNMLYQATCDNIEEVWRARGPNKTHQSSSSAGGGNRREQLAGVRAA